MAHERWLHRCLFLLVSPGTGVGGKTLVQGSGQVLWELLVQEGRGAPSVRTCQKYQEREEQQLLPIQLKTVPRWEAERPGGEFPTDGLAHCP